MDKQTKKKKVGGDPGGCFRVEGVWVCVCCLKYPAFGVLYFDFLYNY